MLHPRLPTFKVELIIKLRYVLVIIFSFESENTFSPTYYKPVELILYLENSDVTKNRANRKPDLSKHILKTTRKVLRSDLLILSLNIQNKFQFGHRRPQELENFDKIIFVS